MTQAIDGRIRGHIALSSEIGARTPLTQIAPVARTFIA
jgi:hypothetical protein